MPSRLEKEEEAEVGKWCKQMGILFIKFTPRGERGWPDRICIFPNGQHVWLEMKRLGKKPNKLQLYRARQIKENKGEAIWADSAQSAIDKLTWYLL